MTCGLYKVYGPRKVNSESHLGTVPMIVTGVKCLLL